jgi:hypothetical protein
MAADKDKGLVGGASDIVGGATDSLGGATDSLRQTTSGLGGGGPWHTANSDVYHNNPSCQTGNSIDPENVQQGTANKSLCGECAKLNSAGGPVGNLTGL